MVVRPCRSLGAVVARRSEKHQTSTHDKPWTRAANWALAFSEATACEPHGARVLVRPPPRVSTLATPLLGDLLGCDFIRQAFIRVASVHLPNRQRMMLCIRSLLRMSKTLLQRKRRLANSGIQDGHDHSAGPALFWCSEYPTLALKMFCHTYHLVPCWDGYYVLGGWARRASRSHALSKCAPC